MSSSNSREASRTSVKSSQSSAVPNFLPNPSQLTKESEPSINQPGSNEENGAKQANSKLLEDERIFIPWRIFVNNIDSYHGKKLAESLPQRESTLDSRAEDLDTVDDMMDESDETEDGKSPGRKNQRPDALNEDDIDDEEETNLRERKDRTKKPKLEVVGTVKDEEYKRPEEVTMVIRTTKNRELLLRELMKCGVVIYDITEDDSQIEEANWALEAIVEDLRRFRQDTPKASERNTECRYFVLISTLMTWALTKPIDPENPDLPLTEKDYRKRKPHPNFKEHIKCEKTVATIAKRNNITDKLKTIVLGTGITYGDEEGPLHYLFKMAWNNAEYLPIFGSGLNKVPLLHVRDLVEVVHMLVKKWPKSRYIVAVEQDIVSQTTIVKRISKALTTGKVQLVTPSEAFLFPELSQRSYDMTNVNINIMPGYIVDNELNWHWDMPFRDNIDALVEEYKKSRKLYPVKMIVLGPPASGKTFLARKLAQHYKTHYVHVKNLIEDTIQKLSKEIEAGTVSDTGKQNNAKVDFEDSEEEGEEDEDTSTVDNLQEELNEIRENLAKNNGRLSDDILNKLFTKRLLSKECQNQGYVIDGFPKTLTQAEALFGSVDDDENIEEWDNNFSDVSMIGGNTKIMPELVIVLEATDDFLIERVILLPEKDIQQTHYDEEGMLRRLKEYRERNTDDETPVQFFDEREIHPLVINVEDDTCPDMFSSFVQCIERLGEPRNYGPSDAEREEAKRLSEAEALAALKIEKARKDREDFERKRERERKMMEWTDLFDKLKQEEEQQLCIMVEPLRHYLCKYIFPTLTKGLIEVATLRPEDPIDFLIFQIALEDGAAKILYVMNIVPYMHDRVLDNRISTKTLGDYTPHEHQMGKAEFLFRENPEGKMFEPDYTETMSDLLDAIEKFKNQILPPNELDSENGRYLTMKERQQRVETGEDCECFSNDEAIILTDEDEGDGIKGKRITTSRSIEMENSSGVGATSSGSGERNYTRSAMVASSFSYEQIAEGSRNSFENSTNISLQDSREESEG